MNGLNKSNALKLFIFFFMLSIHAGPQNVFAVKLVKIDSTKSIGTKKEDPPKKNKLAKWSLILTAAGFLSIYIPFLVMLSPYLMAGGMVCGIIALSQIKKSREKGKGLAIASLVVGGVYLIIAMVAIAILLSIFN